MTLCSRCKTRPPRAGQRYCVECHAAYMRETRPTFGELTPEQKKKSIARGYTKTYIKRGKLIPQPCEECGADERVEAHHVDYDSPLCVFWLCRSCHLEHHNRLATRSKLKAVSR